MLDPSIEILAAAARAYLRLVTLIAEGEEPDYDAVTELLHDEDIDLELVQQIIDAAIGSRVLVSPEHGLHDGPADPRSDHQMPGLWWYWSWKSP
jgi:hypothetical protein